MSLDKLTTEARNPASSRLDELTPLEIALLMNREDEAAVAAVATQAEAIARAIDLIADALRAGGRLIYVGAGTSGRLGVLDATECPPTFNTPPGLVLGLIAGGPPALTRAVEGAEDHPEEGEKALQAIDFRAADVLVGIATSGRTPFVIGAAVYAKSLGARVIGLACNVGSELEPHVDLMVCPVVGPEVLSGSTRLKAGTATKLVLNTFTTGAMVRLGKTFGNLMVDLRATNIKLKARTNRIVRILGGVDEVTAADILHRAGGELKTAIVMQAAGVDAEAARQRLAEAGGRISVALEGLKRPATGSVKASLVIGIDGGGTHTSAILAEGSQIIGRGEAGPGNLQAVGVTRALAAMDEAIARAFADANHERATVGAICLGLAGADRPEDKSIVKEWVERQRVAEWCEITNDGALLLAAGTPDGWGVALVSGTGSIAVAGDRYRKLFRCGGWGYLLGDEGSGYALVMAALQAAARAADGREPPTAMTEPLLKAMNLAKPTDFIGAVYRGGWDRAKLAALAPVVLTAAELGDPSARAIADRGAADLAKMVATVATAAELNLNQLPLAMAGGALLHSESYRDDVLRALAARGVRPSTVTLVSEPALGAVRIASERTGATV